MSARLSTALPRACSATMYAAVPRIIPACVIAGDVIVGDIDMSSATDRAAGSIAFASPKSSTFTVPSVRTLMFAGFRSRWMIPCSCAASRASAICFAIGRASSIGIAPCAIRCERSSPSTSSITSAVTPAALRGRDVRDVRMVQRREHFRFALKACEPIVIRRDGRRQNLDGDLALQLGVGGPIHLAHAAFANLGGDFVDAEPRAGGKGQSLWIIGGDTGRVGRESLERNSPNASRRVPFRVSLKWKNRQKPANGDKRWQALEDPT